MKNIDLAENAKYAESTKNRRMVSLAALAILARGKIEKH